MGSLALDELGEDLDELALHYAPEEQVLCASMKHSQSAAFSMALLTNIRTLQTQLGAADALPVKWLVWRSSLPGVYSCGGDLGLFAELIRERRADQLKAYSDACIDAIYANLNSWCELAMALDDVNLRHMDRLARTHEHCAAKSERQPVAA